MTEIRTRFAPSPTGYLHVGNIRTGLFAYLLAKKQGGKFYLRIEDTDRARFVPDAEDQIKDSLRWLGLEWEPDVWHQSDRLDVYRQKALELVKAGRAWIADDAAEEITTWREGVKAAMEDSALPMPQLPSMSRPVDPANYDPAQGHVIRFKWPENQQRIRLQYYAGSRLSDLVVDPAMARSAFEPFILIKSDGYPTYNFAHVIDDAEMGITHVVRGDEFTSSLHKYWALQEALGVPHPEFIHVPPILGPDGKKKLSKREGAQQTQEYREAGYLPESIANFIALIGWSAGDRELFFSLEELTAAFDVSGLQQSPGVFDLPKLGWMNKQHMLNRDKGELFEVAVAEGFWQPTGEAKERQVFELSLERATTLGDLKQVEDFYQTAPKLTREQLVGDENPETVGVWLERTQRYLETVTDWTADRLQGALKDVLNEADLVPKQLYPILREALTGAPQTPAIWDVMAALGKDETLNRLESAQSLVA